MPPLAMLEPVADEPVAEPEPVPANVSPLDFLCSIYRNAGLPLATRIRAATSAAQYCHPRISVLVPPGGNIAERLERLILEQRKKPKLIEHAPLIRRRI
jgi:hypothetical protein